MNELTRIFESFPSDSRMEAIAKWYDEQPVNRRCHLVDATCWIQLATEYTFMAGAIRVLVHVIEDDASEPYATAQEMVHNIRLNQFRVSVANCDHPLWSSKQNIDFRIVHDVLGHYPTGADFSWDGEIAPF